MNPTGQQLVEQGIITKVQNEENIQQHGIDLNILSIKRVLGGGSIPKAGKTVLPTTQEVFPEADGSWFLNPGVYDVVCEQGCKVPPNLRLKVVQRSSLQRNGVQVGGSLFDAGFETENIGSIMFVHVPINIEKGARIAQIYADVSNNVDNLYEGQFQNDSQRQA